MIGAVFCCIQSLLCTVHAESEETDESSPSILKELPVSSEYLENCHVSRHIATGSKTRVFFTLSEFANYWVDPSILVNTSFGWIRFAVPSEFKMYSWRYAGSNTRAPYVWAVLDNEPEAPSWNIEILRGSMSGTIWHHVATLKKYSYMDHFHEFRMDANGVGSVTIYHPAAEFTVTGPMTGYYVYQTSDWGETWSESDYIPDDLKHMNPVKQYDGEPLADIVSKLGLELPKKVKVEESNDAR